MPIQATKSGSPANGSGNSGERIREIPLPQWMRPAVTPNEEVFIQPNTWSDWEARLIDFPKARDWLLTSGSMEDLYGNLIIADSHPAVSTLDPNRRSELKAELDRSVSLAESLFGDEKIASTLLTDKKFSVIGREYNDAKNGLRRVPTIYLATPLEYQARVFIDLVTKFKDLNVLSQLNVAINRESLHGNLEAPLPAVEDNNVIIYCNDDQKIVGMVLATLTKYVKNDPSFSYDNSILSALGRNAATTFSIPILNGIIRYVERLGSGSWDTGTAKRLQNYFGVEDSPFNSPNRDRIIRVFKATGNKDTRVNIVNENTRRAVPEFGKRLTRIPGLLLD